MAKDKTWGDGFVVEAATALYQRPAVVLLAGQESPTQVCSHLSSSPTTTPMYLGYVAVMSKEGNHYVSLKPDEQSLCGIEGQHLHCTRS